MKLPPPPPPPKMKALAPTRELLHHFPLTEAYETPKASAYVPAWLQVLRDCGKPTDVLTLDFETYYDDEYKMMGKGDGLSTVEYITDTRFEILGLASLLMHGELPFADYEPRTSFAYDTGVVGVLKYYQHKYGPNLERCTVVAQNASFDLMILAIVFGIHPPHVIDTLGLARAWNSRAKNDLETLCERWHLPPKGDTSEFKQLTFRTRFKRVKSRKKGPKLPIQIPKITPEQIERLSKYACNDAAREWEVCTLLLPRLSRPKVELRLMQLTLEMFTKPCIAVDFAKGEELIRLMNAEIDRVMSDLGVTREEISGDKSFEALLLDALAKADDHAQKYYKVGKRGYILAIAKTDPEREQLAKHSSPRVRSLMAARAALDSWPNHIKRIQRIMGQARPLDLLPVPLAYHGAHTGRDTGKEKINLQNLGSRGHPLVNAVRETLIAPPGKKLVIIDLSGIEFRGTGWISGHAKRLDEIREQDANPHATTDQYTRFASEILGWQVRKPRKNGIPAIEVRHKKARNGIGKVPALGCDYGLGTDRLMEIVGTDDRDLCERIKTTYRENNKPVVQFWKGLERAFIYTAKYRSSCSLDRGLLFDSAPDCDVVCTLPSGRELHYHSVELVEGNFGGDAIRVLNQMEHKWEHTWGGSLTENVVQAMSRDILMEASIRLEGMGFHTAHRVHDELILCVDEDQADTALEAALTELRRTPEWAPGLPLNAEGKVSDAYGDH